ncbi:MAG: PKD domain-containing protein [Thermofilaceae archaeon]
MVDVWQLVSYGLWIAFACGLGSFIYGVVLRVLGREDYSRYIAGGLASILIVAFGWGLVQALYGGATPPLPYGWVFYAISGALLVSAAVYLALGRMAEGAWSLVGALLVVGIGFFAASLATGVEIGPGGTVSVTVVASTTMLKNNEELKLTVIPAGGEPPYTVTVNWGDNTTSQETTYTNITFTKKYALPGDEPAGSYTIRVDVADAKGKAGFNVLAVTVQNQDYCPLGWPFNFLCGFYKLVSAVIPSIDLQKLVECPLFPESGELHELYKFVLSVSMAGLGLFLAFNLAWSVVGREDVAGGLVQSIKDAVVVVALALLAPYVYNATAQMLNTISYSLIDKINIGWVFAWIMLQIVLGVVIGYFVPFVANYAAFMAITLFLASVVVYIRYVLITTLVAASPLLAVAYLHPGLRGVVKHAVNLLAGLMIAGPIAAVFLVVLSKVVPGQDVVFGILYPLIVGALPSILGVFGAGIVGGVAGALRRGVAALGGALGRALKRETEATEAPARGETATIKLRAPAVTATPAKISAYPKLEAPIAQQAKLEKPAPIVTPSMVKHARTEAEAKREVFESVREMQELGPGVVAVTEGADRAKQVEQEVKEELVHPRWESFKTFTREIASQSWRQLRTNLRSLQSEFYQGLKHLAERELGVKLPESVRISINSRAGEVGINSLSKYKQRKISRDLAFVSH